MCFAKQGTLDHLHSMKIQYVKTTEPFTLLGKSGHSIGVSFETFSTGENHGFIVSDLINALFVSV